MKKRITKLVLSLLITIFAAAPYLPFEEANAADVKRIGAGDQHSIILSEDGKSILASGRNQFGQLGTGSTKDAILPQSVVELPRSSITQVAAGRSFSAFLTNDGEVYTWGNNQDGQLGRDVTINEKDVSQTLENLLAEPFANVLEDAFYEFHESSHTLEGLIGELDRTERKTAYEQWEKTTIQYAALKMMEKLNTNDIDLILRRETGFKREIEAFIFKKEEISPREIFTDSDRKRFSDVTAISAGDSHMLALKDDGTVWAWGNNDYGQLGVHTTKSEQAPVKINFLKDIEKVVANDSHSLALSKDGRLWAWGQNWSGILGNDNFRSTAPVEITDIKDVESMSSGRNHLLFLKDDGTVWTVNLSNINENNLRIEPMPVPNLANIVEVAAGDNFNLALKNDGTLWAWGFNNEGQLGDGTTEKKSEPIEVTTIPKVAAISAGTDTSFAITTSGDLYAWGSNQYGKLGIEEKETILSPEKIKIITVEDITMYPKQLTLEKNETAALYVSINPVDAPVESIEWKSSNNAIVEVDQDGKLSACRYCSGGKAVITVIVNDRFEDNATIEVVSENDVSRLSIEIGEQRAAAKEADTWWLGLGELVHLKANVKPYDADASSVIWTSSDPRSASVNPIGDASVMRGLTPGKVIISATNLYEDDDLKEVEDTFTVKTYVWQEWSAQTSQDRYKKWQITFDSPINSATVNEDTVYIVDEDGERIKTHTIITNGKTVAVRPADAFNFDEKYTLYISKNIKSSNDDHVLKNGIKMPFEIER